MKILVVIDMQNDFIDGSLGTKEATEIVSRVVNKIKTFDGSVVYTRDTHSEEYLSTLEGKSLPIKHCIKNTYGWEINKDVFSAGENKNSGKYLKKIYDKKTFGCVELGNDIEIECAFCDDEEITIELVGLCTDICVISNALLIKASVPEATIVVDGNCCAGVTPESHNRALEAMKMCQINIVGGK